MQILSFNPLEGTEIESNELFDFSIEVDIDTVINDIFLMGAFVTEIEYHLAYKVVIEVADTDDFIEPEIFESDYIKRGDGATLKLFFQTSGEKYLRITATDGEGSSDTLITTLSSVLFLYFLEEPSVEKSNPQATHIIVKSPTASATAQLNVSDSLKVERLFEIEEGDEAVCQELADELLEKWGREQINVTGKINLNVSLNFKEEVGIKIPEANIDDTLIVQQITHNITGKSTEVSCGDLNIDDNELLSRILEEME